MDTNFYLGKFEKCFLGYSEDKNIRCGAASGGIVSTLLIHLLERQYIDGVLISKQVMENGNISVKTFIARTKKEILDCRTSIYMDFPLVHHYKELLKEKGKYAVVGLPCHMKALRIIEKKYPKLSKKIFIRIGLFCGHVSRKELIERVLEKKKIQKKNINKIIFRKGLWRGNTHITLKNGKEEIFQFNHFGIYQNLNFFSAKKCFLCDDYTSEFSDISCGDIWKKEFKSSSIKYSVFISRNRKITKIINKFKKNNIIVANVISSKGLIKSQKRALILRKRSSSARMRVARLFGYKLKYHGENKSKWNDYLSSFLLILNAKLSDNPLFSKIIFYTPRSILNLYFYFICFLLSF